jgi:hypothetical protein
LEDQGIGDQVQIVKYKDILFRGDDFIPDQGEIPVKLPFRFGKADAGKIFRRLGIHPPYFPGVILPKTPGQVIPFRKLHPDDGPGICLEKRMNRVRFTVPFPGDHGDHMTLQGLFQYPVYPGPFQKNPASGGGGMDFFLTFHFFYFKLSIL